MTATTSLFYVDFLPLLTNAVSECEKREDRNKRNYDGVTLYIWICLKAMRALATTLLTRKKVGHTTTLLNKLQIIIVEMVLDFMTKHEAMCTNPLLLPPVNMVAIFHPL